MKEFELKLDNVTYKCAGTQAERTDQNWHIKATVDGIQIGMVVPIENKRSRAQIMSFVERFHEAFRVAKKEQGEAM